MKRKNIDFDLDYFNIVEAPKKDDMLSFENGSSQIYIFFKATLSLADSLRHDSI